MKKVLLLIAMLVLVTGMIACGGKGNSGNNSGGSTAGETSEPKEAVKVNKDKVYQYEAVSAEDVQVEYKGKLYTLSGLPEGVECEVVSPVYSGEVITVMLDGEELVGNVEGYVKAKGIFWTYNGLPSFPTVDEADFNKDKVTGIIEYEDGTKKEINVGYAVLNGDSIMVSDGINTFTWESGGEDIDLEFSVDDAKKELEERKSSDSEDSTVDSEEPVEDGTASDEMDVSPGSDTE